MTPICRPVRRESYGTVFDRGKRRPVIVSIESPNLLGFRLKGTRRIYHLTTEACFSMALKAALRAEAAEKKARRRARR